MKITAFNPVILTREAETVVDLFEALGFERQHLKTGITDKDISTVSMEDAAGSHVDVTSVTAFPTDMTVIRMNVDDFDEAYALLEAHGFRNAQGDYVTDTGSSIATLMISPSGFAINLVKHIKQA